MVSIKSLKSRGSSINYHYGTRGMGDCAEIILVVKIQVLFLGRNKRRPVLLLLTAINQGNQAEGVKPSFPV
jgi:hypothetical protein